MSRTRPQEHGAPHTAARPAAVGRTPRPGQLWTRTPSRPPPKSPSNSDPASQPTASPLQTALACRPVPGGQTDAAATYKRLLALRGGPSSQGPGGPREPPRRPAPTAPASPTSLSGGRPPGESVGGVSVELGSLPLCRQSLCILPRPRQSRCKTRVASALPPRRAAKEPEEQKPQLPPASATEAAQCRESQEATSTRQGQSPGRGGRRCPRDGPRGHCLSAGCEAPRLPDHRHSAHRLAPPRSRGLVLQLYVSLVNGGSFRLMSSKACPSPAGLCLCSCGCPQVSGPCAHHFRTGRGRQESVLVPQATEERPRVCLGLLGPARSSAALKCLPAQQGGRSSGSPSPPVQSPDATANQSPRREIPRSCTPGIPGSGVCP